VTSKLISLVIICRLAVEVVSIHPSAECAPPAAISMKSSCPQTAPMSRSANKITAYLWVSNVVWEKVWSSVFSRAL